MELTSLERSMFHRTALLVGEEGLERLSNVRVILFGCGGVGSWCAESLVRSGIRHLTVVDSDVVCVTNCNRQLMATSRTIGEVKVEVLKARLLELNPHAEITALQKVYSAETAAEFHLEEYDYVIDAIDSLKDKAQLILHATSLTKAARHPQTTTHNPRPTTLFSSMGAALRMDPTKIRVAEFWKVQNDALARALRHKFKALDQFPAVKFQCVYSEEPVMQNKEVASTLEDGRKVSEVDTAMFKKAQTNGTLSHITSIFGFTLAGLVLQDIIRK